MNTIGRFVLFLCACFAVFGIMLVAVGQAINGTTGVLIACIGGGLVGLSIGAGFVSWYNFFR